MTGVTVFPSEGRSSETAACPGHIAHFWVFILFFYIRLISYFVMFSHFEMTSYLLSYKEQNPLKFSGFMYSKWSWRESNLRPNRETRPVLHVYSSLWFSCCGKTWTTNRSLIPLNFHLATEVLQGIPDLPAPLTKELRNNSLWASRPLPLVVDWAVTYCDSVWQREVLFSN